MSIELIDKIKPKNGGSFPMVEAVDVAVDSSGRRLDDVVATEYNTPSVAVPTTIISQSDYEALEESGEVEQNRLYLVYEEEGE